MPSPDATDAKSKSSNQLQLPLYTPERWPWWKLASGRVLLASPAFFRQPFGFYHWDEILRGDADKVQRHASKGPIVSNGVVARMAHMRVKLPVNFHPVPNIVEDGAHSWNRDAHFDIGPRDLDGWIWAWKAHPKGKKALNQALAVAAAASDKYSFRRLLQYGANKKGGSKRTGPMIDRLLSSQNDDGVIDCLTILHQEFGGVPWEKAKDFYDPLWMTPTLIKMETLGVLPVGSAREDAILKLVDDIPLYGSGENQRLDAIRWWLSPKRMGEDVLLRGKMIEKWLETVRPGLDDEDQESLHRYWQVLTQGLDELPDTHAAGHWGHAWMKSKFPHAIPDEVIDAFMSHSSWDLQGKDENGKTVVELLDTAIEQNDCRSSVEPKERERYATFEALLHAEELDAATADAPELPLATRGPQRRL